MTLQQIMYFQRVARSGSFTKAARACFVSQTAISRDVYKRQDIELEIVGVAHGIAVVHRTAVDAHADDVIPVPLHGTGAVLVLSLIHISHNILRPVSADIPT